MVQGTEQSAGVQGQQIRSSPADVANTILKMATKRALIALTLVSLGASDIFAQDLEDLTEELRESVISHDAPKPETKQPQRRSATAGAAPAPTARPLPEGALVVTGHVLKVEKPAGKTYWLIRLKGDNRYFSTFTESLAKGRHGLRRYRPRGQPGLHGNREERPDVHQRGRRVDRRCRPATPGRGPG